MTIHWNRRSYTKEQFLDAWNTSKNLSDVLRTLNLPIAGGNLNTISNTAIELGLTRDHFDTFYKTRERINNGNNLPQNSKRPLEEILVEGSNYGTNRLKQRLIDEGLKDPICESDNCLIPDELKHLAPFTLDHINGVNNDHRLENLRILCYNCHAMTDTWCGRNRRRNNPSVHPDNIKVRPKKDREQKQCIDCDSLIDMRATRCREHASMQRRGVLQIDWPPIEIMVESVQEKGYLAYSKELGVSDNGIRKYFKANGLSNNMPKKNKVLR